MLECVVNISEGRRADILQDLARSLDPTTLLDVHVDPWHHRSVWTLVGTDAPRQLTRRAVELLDLAGHEGAHPRLGVVDVVPFVPLDSSSIGEALAARDDFARWLAADLHVPGFLYGPEGTAPHRTLPAVRRQAWRTLYPDFGPPTPHPTAGAVCIGARPVLVAYNVWLSPGADWSTATEVTAAVRSPIVRALTLRLGDHIQISMNLVEPNTFGPDAAFAEVESLCEERGLDIERAELVGLVPEGVLADIPRRHWTKLDVGTDRTIEYRLGLAGRSSD